MGGDYLRYETATQDLKDSREGYEKIVRARQKQAKQTPLARQRKLPAPGPPEQICDRSSPCPPTEPASPPLSLEVLQRMASARVAAQAKRARTAAIVGVPDVQAQGFTPSKSACKRRASAARTESISAAALAGSGVGVLVASMEARSQPNYVPNGGQPNLPRHQAQVQQRRMESRAGDKLVRTGGGARQRDAGIGNGFGVHTDDEWNVFHECKVRIHLPLHPHQFIPSVRIGRPSP